MTTETAAPTSTPTPAATETAAPAPEQVVDNTPTSETIEARTPAYSEEFTPEEKAYFESRGKDTTGFKDYRPEPAPQYVPAAEQTPAPAPQQQATTTAPAPAPAVETVPDNEEVNLDDLSVANDGSIRDKKGRFVPQQALHAARERYKSERARADASTKEAETLREQIANLSGRLESLTALQAKPAAVEAPAAAAEPEDVRPDPQVDIFGYVEWQERQINKLHKRLEDTANSSKQAVDAVTGRMTEQQMLSSYRQDAQSFAAAKPEFAQAYRHLMDARHAELALLGVNDPAERSKMISQEERSLVENAYKSGRRPSELIFNIAVSRGFRHEPKPTPTPEPTPAAAAPLALTQPNPAPTIVPPQNATPAANTAAQQLANAQAAQAATATLSGHGGSGGEGLSMQALLDMDDNQFAEVSKKLGKKGMAQYLGR